MSNNNCSLRDSHIVPSFAGPPSLLLMGCQHCSLKICAASSVPSVPFGFSSVASGTSSPSPSLFGSSSSAAAAASSPFGASSGPSISGASVFGSSAPFLFESSVVSSCTAPAFVWRGSYNSISCFIRPKSKSNSSRVEEAHLSFVVLVVSTSASAAPATSISSTTVGQTSSTLVVASTIGFLIYLAVFTVENHFDCWYFSDYCTKITIRDHRKDYGGGVLSGNKESLGRMEKGAGKDREDQQSEGSGSHEEENNWEQRVEDLNGKEGGKYRKLEIPLFDGDEAIGWFFKVERYFSLNQMQEGEKLEAVAVCMEGKVLNWLQWLETRMNIQSWSEFKKELLCRFHKSQQGNNYEMLMALKQEGTVAEYREQFELLSAPLKEAPKRCS
ncbi:1-phosphatidylinositol-3-phosphate 5-kinase [Senna tora]|uniref:1-phosphatidylinositol-3-phosphate 5-kinase n=1 Tax=Senna tora TaxID=362788 RepID=A0A834TPC3_9FABA|nr:1-phosphatidylinositol-3-phosphate 5-kinase [Senna tora]